MGEFRIIKSVGEIEYPNFPKQIAYVVRDIAPEGEEKGVLDYDYSFGILYNGVIICGCCGAPISLSELIIEYDEVWICEFNSWIDLCEFIGGDFQEALCNAAGAIDEENDWTEMENILYFGG